MFILGLGTVFLSTKRFRNDPVQKQQSKNFHYYGITVSSWQKFSRAVTSERLRPRLSHSTEYTFVLFVVKASVYHKLFPTPIKSNDVQ